MLEAIAFLLIPFILGFTAGVVFILVKLKGGERWIRVLEADLEQAQERAERLEQDLQHKQEEIAHYKDQVTSHFIKTAELFNTLTNDYRSIYEHMVKGAHELCSGSVVQVSAPMLNERLLTQNENEIQKLTEGGDKPINEISAKTLSSETDYEAEKLKGTKSQDTSTIVNPN